MLAIMSAVFGFLAPFVPEVIKYFRSAQDAKHELAMMEMRLKAGAQEHLWRMEEINARADIAEATELHRPAQSFGVDLLDAAQRWAETIWGKVLIFPVFYLFALLDFISGMVRPTITYAAFAFYAAYKWASFEAARGNVGSNLDAILATWGEQDWAVLVLVLSYWFGHRAAKAAFGGSAMTSRAGG